MRFNDAQDCCSVQFVRSMWIGSSCRQKVLLHTIIRLLGLDGLRVPAMRSFCPSPRLLVLESKYAIQAAFLLLAVRSDRSLCVRLSVLACFVFYNPLFCVLIIIHGRMLRARQLTKLLLNAPLLSLSRLHVTALMGQAHIVDGMVNYVDLVYKRARTSVPLALRCRNQYHAFVVLL